MTDSPLLSKMDALLKKHRGAAEPVPAVGTVPPDAWLPVLTDVIVRGVNPHSIAPTPVPATPAAADAGNFEEAAVQVPPAVATRPEPPPPPVAVMDSMAEQLMSELAPKLSEVMEKQVAAELRRNLDETVATLLSQLDVNVREIVRDAVAQKLGAQHQAGDKKS